MLLRLKTSIILSITSFIFWSCNPSEERSGIFDRLSFYQPEGFTDSLLVGTFEVFENRETQSGRKIPLSIVVTPALERECLKEPIFILDGGPGIGVSHQAYFYTEIDDRYRRCHDIIFVDVRGTGNSQPLHCIELQTKASPTEHFDHPYQTRELEACLNMYRDTVDFNFYKTEYIVEDLEEVRQWLGYDKINLIGISFGGKVALRYMDRFPAAINRTVLHAPDGPNIDHLGHRGRNSQRALDILFSHCVQDSSCNSAYPDIDTEFVALMNRIKKGGVFADATVKDSTYRIELSWPPIANKIAGLLYDDAGYVQIPHIVHEAYLENYEPLLNAFNFGNTDTNFFYADGMFFSNFCAEDMPFALQNFSEEENATFLGDYMFQTRRDACATWPVEPIDESLAKGVISDLPTLIFSGNLDPTLPPETGALIANGLTNSLQIEIPHMGHMFAALTNLECYDDYVIAFLENREETEDKECFKSMKPNPFKLPSTR